MLLFCIRALDDVLRHITLSVRFKTRVIYSDAARLFEKKNGVMNLSRRALLPLLKRALPS